MHLLEQYLELRPPSIGHGPGPIPSRRPICLGVPRLRLDDAPARAVPGAAAPQYRPWAWAYPE